LHWTAQPGNDPETAQILPIERTASPKWQELVAEMKNFRWRSLAGEEQGGNSPTGRKRA
jgi:hypothetical protein